MCSGTIGQAPWPGSLQWARPIVILLQAQGVLYVTWPIVPGPVGLAREAEPCVPFPLGRTQWAGPVWPGTSGQAQWSGSSHWARPVVILLCAQGGTVCPWIPRDFVGLCINLGAVFHFPLSDGLSTYTLSERHYRVRHSVLQSTQRSTYLASRPVPGLRTTPEVLGH